MVVKNKNIELIVDDKFDIIRFEGFGYVQNICNYDPNIFELEKLYESSNKEGGDCKTTYKFKIKHKKDALIEFTEDYGDYMIITSYFYNSQLNNLTKTTSMPEPKQKFVMKIKNKKSCLIL